MPMKWYRAYVGLVGDAKLAEIAMRAKVDRPLAIAAWLAILESAAERNADGRYSMTASRLAAALGKSLEELERVIAAMDEIGMTAGGQVIAWTKRQFPNDSSAERTRAYRARQRQSNGDVTSPAVTVTASDGDVTSPKRPVTKSDALDTDSESDVTSLRSLTSDSTPLASLEARQPGSPNGSPADPPPAAKKLFRAESDQALLDRITDVWNAWASKHGSPQVQRLSDMRAQHCRRRMAELVEYYPDVPIEKAFAKLLGVVEQSFFVQGSPRHPIRFDQLMREGFVANLVEGSYRYNPKGAPRYGQK
jgi:hypothetical protein